MPKRKSTSRSTPKGALPNTQLIEHSPRTRRLLTRLSKDSLLDIVLDSWLNPAKVGIWTPDLTGGAEDGTELTLDHVREIYEGYRKAKGVRIKDIAERIVEKEWKWGLKVGMIAECDVRYLLDHPSTYKWVAALLHPISSTTSTSVSVPLPLYFSTILFTHSLTSMLNPLLSLHIHSIQHPTLPLSILRLQIHEQTSLPKPSIPIPLPAAKRIFYLAFPHSAHHIFLTLSAGTDELRDIVRQSIAAAISREHSRFSLKSTNLSARTLEALVHFRGTEAGSGDGGMVAGGWSIYTAGLVDPNPLEPFRRTIATSIPRDTPEDPEEESRKKRLKLAEERFGCSAKLGDGKGLESVEFRLEEAFAEKGEGGKGFTPSVTVKLDGTHVFAGVRSLVEAGVGFDPKKMPGWVTGENGVSVGVIKEGNVVRKKRF